MHLRFYFTFFLRRTAEHTLSVTIGIHRSHICTNTTSIDVESFLKQGWPQIYTVIRYDGGVRGIMGEILNYHCVFQWVFMDLLIISITICLSKRFHQLNEHLKQYKGMVN